MIKAELVKELREKTGAGMMDCKKALLENGGDFNQAIEWLRTKGLASAGKKKDRVAAEGVVAAITDHNAGVIIEMNSETDFVARSDDFQQLAHNVVNLALNHKMSNLEELKQALLSSDKTIDEALLELIAKIGENITLRRVGYLSVSPGIVASYVHNKISSNMGRIAVIVALRSESVDHEALHKLANQIALHIAASKPSSLDIASLDEKLIESEKAIFAAQAKESGKPANVIEKMVEGRVKKFLSEVVLLEQNFVFDEKITIKDLLAKASVELGHPVTIEAFIRYEVGEGIEKEAADFAGEVAALMQ